MCTHTHTYIMFFIYILYVLSSCCYCHLGLPHLLLLLSSVVCPLPLCPVGQQPPSRQSGSGNPTGSSLGLSPPPLGVSSIFTSGPPVHIQHGWVTAGIVYRNLCLYIYIYIYIYIYTHIYTFCFLALLWCTKRGKTILQYRFVLLISHMYNTGFQR